MKSIFSFLFLFFHLCILSAQCGLITNGDFQAGNVGFTSNDQTYTASPCVLDDQYTITNNIFCYSGAWNLPADHTTGTGNMMLVNITGAVTTPRVYCTSFATNPGQIYRFSYWVANPNGDPGIPQLDLKVNGIPLSSPITIPSYSGWLSKSHTFPAFTTTTNVCIYSYNTPVITNGITFGYDVALDDICAEPIFDSIRVRFLNTSSSMCVGDTAKFRFDYYGFNGSICFNVYDGVNLQQLTFHNGDIYKVAVTAANTVFSFSSQFCNGNGFIKNYPVTVNLAPTANFSTNDICAGHSNIVNLNNSTPGGTFSIVSPIIDQVAINSNTGVLSNYTPGNSYIIQYQVQTGTCIATNKDTVRTTAKDNGSFSVADFCENSSNQNIPVLPGGTYSFSPSPADAAQINANTGVISSYTPGNTYNIRYITNGICPDTSYEDVKVILQADPTFFYSDFCPGSLTYPVASGASGGVYTFRFDPADGATIDPSSGLINNEIGGTDYFVQYKVGVCPDSLTRKVTVFEEPTATISGTGDICDLVPDSFVILLTGNPPFDFIYYNGNNPINVSGYNSFSYATHITEPSNYNMVSVKDLNCNGTHSGSANFVSDNILLSIDTGKGCPGTTTQLNIVSNISPQASCLWNFGDGQTAQTCASQTHLYKDPGCYDVSLTITASSGCKGTTTKNDLFCTYELPVASYFMTPEQPTYIYNDVKLHETATNEAILQWYNGINFLSDSDIVDLELPIDTNILTEICLVAISEEGCKDTICKKIKVQEDHVFFIPNTFTPNEDGLNEIFKPIIKQVSNYDFKIYDRWGKVVYETDKTEEGWNGFYKSNLVPLGIYSWVISYINKKGVDEVRYGIVYVVH